MVKVKKAWVYPVTGIFLTGLVVHLVGLVRPRWYQVRCRGQSSGDRGGVHVGLWKVCGAQRGWSGGEPACEELTRLHPTGPQPDWLKAAFFSTTAGCACSCLTFLILVGHCFASGDFLVKSAPGLGCCCFASAALLLLGIANVTVGQFHMQALFPVDVCHVHDVTLSQSFTLSGISFLFMAAAGVCATIAGAFLSARPSPKIRKRTKEEEAVGEDNPVFVHPFLHVSTEAKTE